MPETSSRRITPSDIIEFDVINVLNEKFEELKADIFLEIEQLIHLEV